MQILYNETYFMPNMHMLNLLKIVCRFKYHIYYDYKAMCAMFPELISPMLPPHIHLNRSHDDPGWIDFQFKYPVNTAV